LSRAPSGELRALEGTEEENAGKEEILPFAATGVDFGGIMLNEMSVKDKHYTISLICGI